MSELRYTNITPEYAPQCSALELASFPETEPADLISEEGFRAYAKIFPEGFFICLDEDRVVGQGAGIFLDFDFDHPQHTIAEITGEHQCGNHDPDGDWYYGTDMVVNPDYRRRGIGKQLYELRKQVVRDYNRKGIIAGGHIVGFADHKHEMSAEEYVDKVGRGELYDATLTFQIENGFEVKGVLTNYLEEPALNNCAALICWANPDHRDGR
jgi:GNAT superfamily N-acetyltransferase